jgi:ribosomal protein S18 acetylase RimI-like enzyme
MRYKIDSGDIIIRPLRIEDYDSLITLWNNAQLLYKPKGRDRRDTIDRELQQPMAIFLVAEKEGKIIGSIFGTHDGRKGWINRLAVAPSYRRQGIAVKLLQEVEVRLRTVGIKIIACLIEEWNTVSIQFFEKMGYTCYPDIRYYTKRDFSDI